MSVFEWWNKPCQISSEFITRGKVQANSSAMVERRREEGRDVSTIPGLSKKADEQRKPHGGAFTKAVAGMHGNARHEGKGGRIRAILLECGPLTHRELSEVSGFPYKSIGGLTKNDIDKGRIVVVREAGQLRKFKVIE